MPRRKAIPRERRQYNFPRSLTDKLVQLVEISPGLCETDIINTLVTAEWDAKIGRRLPAPTRAKAFALEQEAQRRERLPREGYVSVRTPSDRWRNEVDIAGRASWKADGLIDPRDRDGRYVQPEPIRTHTQLRAWREANPYPEDVFDAATLAGVEEPTVASPQLDIGEMQRIERQMFPQLYEEE